MKQQLHKSIQFDPEVDIVKTIVEQKNQSNVKMMNSLTIFGFCLHLIMTSNFLVFPCNSSENDKSL